MPSKPSVIFSHDKGRLVCLFDSSRQEFVIFTTGHGIGTPSIPSNLSEDTNKKELKRFKKFREASAYFKRKMKKISKENSTSAKEVLESVREREKAEAKKV